MNIYLDSSVALRYLLNGDPVLTRIHAEYVVGSSELLSIECRRVLQRERMDSHIDDSRYVDSIFNLDALIERMAIIELSDSVKARASGSFPTIIGTLDALHLSSALLWGELISGDISILTYDRQLKLCAKALGIRSFTERL